MRDKTEIDRIIYADESTGSFLKEISETVK